LSSIETDRARSQYGLSVSSVKVVRHNEHGEPVEGCGKVLASVTVHFQLDGFVSVKVRSGVSSAKADSVWFNRLTRHCRAGLSHAAAARLELRGIGIPSAEPL
jgi:hypothetical protein